MKSVSAGRGVDARGQCCNGEHWDKHSVLPDPPAPHSQTYNRGKGVSSVPGYDCEQEAEGKKAAIIRRITTDIPLSPTRPHTSMHACTRMHVRFRPLAQLHMCTCIPGGTYACSGVPVHPGLCVLVHVCMCTCTCGHMHTHTYTGHPDVSSLHHDLYHALGKGPFWVMEQQPGPVNWAEHNPRSTLC